MVTKEKTNLAEEQSELCLSETLGIADSRAFTWIPE